MRKITLFLMTFLLAFTINAQDGTQLYGVRTYESSNTKVFDIVTFNSDDPATIEVLKEKPVTETGVANAYTAGYANGYIYMYTKTSSNVVNGFAKISILDWSVESYTPLTIESTATLTMLQDLAYDSTTDKMYMIFYEVNMDGVNIVPVCYLTTVDLTTGDITIINTLDTFFGMISFDNEGKLYGITQDVLYGALPATLKTINKETATSTTIAVLDGGYAPAFNQSMTYDYASNSIFWTFHASQHKNGNLIKINPTTGAVTDLGMLNNKSQIVGLFSDVLVEEQFPAMNADEVDLFAEPSITFNNNITAGDLSSITITPTVNNISATIEDNTITITHDNFDFLTEYTVTVPKEAIKELNYDISWKFTTLPDPENCNVPSQLNAIKEVEPYQVELAWRENGMATTWNLKYGAKGFDVASEGILLKDIDNNTNYVLSGLNDATEYDVYVQAICYAGIPSDWSSPFTFRTPLDCDKGNTSYPWFEGFESETFPLECWTIYDIDGVGTDGTWRRETYENFVKTGEGSAIHPFANYWEEKDHIQEGWLVTRKMSIPEEGTYALSFWNRNHFLENQAVSTNHICISEGSPDPKDGDFVTVWTAKKIGAEWEEVKVNLSEFYAGKDIYIAFYYEGCEYLVAGAGQTPHGWIIDDLSIDTYSNTDIQLYSIDSPTGGGAGLPADQEIKVTLYNYGSSAITNLPIVLTINGKEVARETISQTISSLRYFEYTFAHKVDLSAPGTYKIEVSVSQEGDTNLDNNYLTRTIVGIPEGDIDLYGYSVFRIPQGADNHFITFSTEDPFWITNLVEYNDGNNFMGAGEYLDGYFYLFTYSEDKKDNHLIKFDAETWTELDRKSVDICPWEMTYDYSTFTMYAALPITMSKSNLYTVNVGNGQLTLVAQVEDYIIGLACDMDGTMYAALRGGTICSIDKQTGDITVIGNTGYQYSSYIQSMAFDHNTGRLFWAVVGNSPTIESRYGGLAEVDKKTGVAYFHDKIGENTQVVGLHTPYKHNVPIAIDDVNVGNGKFNIHPNPSKGMINFSAPDNSNIKIMDLTGKTINTYKVDSSTTSLDLDLPAGLYLILLENNSKVYTNKLVISE